MGRKYSVVGGQSQVASATETNHELAADAAGLTLINRIAVSQNTHDVSEQYIMEMQRVTTTGTGTTKVPELKEGGSQIAQGVYKTDMSAEPTYTGTVPHRTWDWNSLVGKVELWPQGEEFSIAPLALIGINIQTKSGTTTFIPNHSVEFTEIG